LVGQGLTEVVFAGGVRFGRTPQRDGRPEVEHELRNVLRNFATGVCAVTTYSDTADGRRHDAVTVNSFTSLSMRPPLVSLCLRHDSGFLTDMLESKVWAVSILDAGAVDIARSLARDRISRASFVQALSAVPGEQTGALVLDSPSWLECELRDTLTVGDHMMVIGEVISLIFLRGGFHTLEGV
jgi:flavin reductase (DIM6/NTAB) family NADH-FMN oxidoreductase RutF